MGQSPVDADYRTVREKAERRRLRDHPEVWDGELSCDWNQCLGCPTCDAEHAHQYRREDLDEQSDQLMDMWHESV